MSEPKSKVVSTTEDVAAIVKTVEGAECAVLDLVPDVEFEKVRGLEIYVMPDSVVRRLATRADTELSTKVGVAILKRLQKKSDIPELLLLEEKIAEKLERQRLPSGGVVYQVESDPLYDPQEFKEKRLFFALLIVSVKGGVA